MKKKRNFFDDYKSFLDNTLFMLKIFFKIFFNRSKNNKKVLKVEKREVKNI